MKETYHIEMVTADKYKKQDAFDFIVLAKNREEAIEKAQRISDKVYGEGFLEIEHSQHGGSHVEQITDYKIIDN